MGGMPACAIHDDHGMATRCNMAGYLKEVLVCQQQTKIVPCGGVKVYQFGLEKRAFGARFGGVYFGV